ncbi:MAG: hypothetical protein JWO95_67, partial [Verrucomicrobiales bacterium]|nr:hypothetical protein [Verrucomicrobiales bacterium]
VPAKPTPVEPELKLQSILGAGNNRLALINGHTFKAGEQAQLKIDDDIVSAKCLEVATRSAVIEINGTQRTLSLP